MDTQLKRGVLDVCVLSAIRERDSYGYQIIKDLSPCVRLSESTLYTILKRPEAAGLLTVRSAEHNGRLWTSGRSLWRSTASFLERRRLRTNREEFFASLRQRLAGMPPEELADRCAFLGEMIDDRMEEGASESDAVASLGSVEDAAAQILAETPLTHLVKERVRPRRALRDRDARNKGPHRRLHRGRGRDSRPGGGRRLPRRLPRGTGDVSVPATASGGVCEIETSTGDVHIELA